MSEASPDPEVAPPPPAPAASEAAPAQQPEGSGFTRSFTGRSRQRKTSRRVLFMDLAARALITAGGVGTIIAVSTVCVFLVAVVVPLFGSAKSEAPQPIAQQARAAALHVELDEYRILSYTVDRTGTLRLFATGSGETVEEQSLFGEGAPELTAWSFDRTTGTAAFGFADGRFRYARFRWKTRFFDADRMPAELRDLPPGDVAPYRWKARKIAPDGSDVEVERNGLVQRTPIGQFRGQALDVEVMKAVKVSGDKAIGLIAHTATKDDDPPPVVLCWLDGAPPEKALRVVIGKMKRDMMRGTESVSFRTRRWLHQPRRMGGPEDEAAATSAKAAYAALAANGDPSHIAVSAKASHLLVAWPDGRALRYRMRSGQPIRLVEKQLDLVAGDAQLTAARFVLGNETLVVGDSAGAVTAWFAARDDGSRAGQERIVHTVDGEDRLYVFEQGSSALERFRRTGKLENPVVRKLAYRGQMDVYAPSEAVASEFDQVSTIDGTHWVLARTLRTAGPAVSCLAPSTRTRMAAAGFADGSVALFHVTTGVELLTLPGGGEAPIDAVAIAPKENSLIASATDGLNRWKVDPGFGEITLASLFRPVWYEGYPGPIHMWQSSSGDDASEPKLGLMPLVFGTIKGTIYSMLFGAPLALLAAIYTSQFLHPKRKALIKPLIEMMASLPSVVLGFLAGQIFAPVVEQHLPGVLGIFVSVPLTFALGAYLWQMLPFETTLRLQGWRLPLLIGVAIPFGVVVGFGVLGQALEQLLLGGSAREYLDGANQVPRVGSPVGGWALLFFPVCALVVAYLNGRIGQSWLGGNARMWTRQQTATYTLIKFVVAVAVTLALTLILGAIVGTFAEARGHDWSPIDTFDQRNALVVGFAMGFAVIPIIFTIADDALSMVPDHLRFASLGAGATPWQTTMRIVVPTAMSGLFSACMIGLGRAVGETMIVLMATGNVPIMEMNIFQGFRTLSANIATEMPEAVQGSGHYRTLFLAALILFTMTFVLNTIAEAVRLRFRKRAGEL